MPTRSVLIVGAGPAGAVLAYLLARRGVAVTLLEKHLDFARAFRGEGLQPSGLDVFKQIGLADRLASLPQVAVRNLELFRNGRCLARFSPSQLGFFAAFISQPAVLEMLTGEARQFPNFRLEMGVAARDTLSEDGRVVGLRADTPDGPREYRADLIVGTDGRHSTLRKHGSFQELNGEIGFDVLWFKVPFPDFWPNHETVRLELGVGYLAGGIPSSDGLLQTGFTIAKGTFKSLRARGVEAWTEELLSRVSPALANHLRAHREAMARATLLDAIVGRLTTWTAPGLLLLGDAAHPMAPNGGQGLNVALRDAVVAANHLVPVLTAGGDAAAIDAAAERVVAERMPEIVVLQEHQQRQARVFMNPRLMGRLAMWLLPFLVRTGLLKWMMGKRLHALQHGVAEVRLMV